MSLKKSIILILIILIIDQASKIYIKTNFMLQEEAYRVVDWLKIYFIENEGMAWGAKIPGQYGKLLLTLFRLVAVVGIGYWLWNSVRKKRPKILIISISLIFSGAVGNIIDSVFYGVIFEDSFRNVASIFPEGGGYAPLFHGKVVDMLYFPIYNGFLPEWIPIWRSEEHTSELQSR